MFYITHLSGLIKNENIQRHIDEIERWKGKPFLGHSIITVITVDITSKSLKSIMIIIVSYYNNLYLSNLPLK